MERIVVAVGSTRRPKVEAVREALAALGPKFGGPFQFDIAAIEVPSGVRHTPLSRDEMMTGARQRVEALLAASRERNDSWKYFVGLEGGIEVVHERGRRWAFLENWAYVADANGHAFFGRSGSIVLPEPLVKRVVDEGIELAVAVDDFAGETGVRDAQGAWGVLTRNAITRQEAFRIAVISAFAPLLARNAA